MNVKRNCHRLPDTDIYIDYFRKKPVSSNTYILSHFHGDHYSGLSPHWDLPIHCTPVTGSMLVEIMKVKRKFVVTHKMGEAFTVGTVTLTFVDANHCPGAAMIVAKVGEDTHLHTGDCRYHPSMLKILKTLSPRIHTCFLDTTYGLTKISSWAQEDSIKFVVDKVRESLDLYKDKKLTIYVGSYNLGKERILVRLIKEFGLQVWAPPKRRKILWNVGLPDAVLARITDDHVNADVHIMKLNFAGSLWPYFTPKWNNIACHMKVTNTEQAVCFVPSGWANASRWNREHSFWEKDNMRIHLVPYSEHSNLDELNEFMSKLKPAKIVPTVYKDEQEYDKLLKHFNKFCIKRCAMQDLWARAKRSKQYSQPTSVKALPPLKRRSTEPLLSPKRVKKTSEPSDKTKNVNSTSNQEKLLEMGFSPDVVATTLKRTSSLEAAVMLCISSKKTRKIKSKKNKQPDKQRSTLITKFFRVKTKSAG